MVKSVTISEHSKKLMSQLCLLTNDPQLHIWSKLTNGAVERSMLVTWLQQKSAQDKRSRFLLESLRAALLKDLEASFVEKTVTNEQEKKPVGWLARSKFALLATAGVIYAICEGFDGISSVLNLIPSIPVVLVFALGFAFSGLSVAVFHGFNLVEISKNLGVTLKKSRQLLEVFLDQAEQIEKIRKVIDDSYSEITDAYELCALQQMAAMLAIRYIALDEARATYKAALDNPRIKVAKLVIAAVAGVLFFGGGLAVGQTLALAIAGLFVSAVSPTFWPILATSLLVGIAAFGIYWFVERPGFENLVGRWFGLDKDHVDALSDPEMVSTQKRDLNRLEHKVLRHRTLIKQVDELRSKVATTATSGETINHDQSTQRFIHSSKKTSGFFNRSRSTDDLYLLPEAAPKGLEYP